MEYAKTRNLYADLGLADYWASLAEIDLAYEELMSKLDPEVNPAAAPADAAELSKIRCAYMILSDPEKRAEYNRIRADLFKYKTKSATRRRYKAGWRSPLDQMLRVARMQLESKVWQQARTRRLPLNTQLRAKAQLRAHAYHLDLFHALSKSHGKAVALHHVGLGPVEEVPQYWTIFDPSSEHGKTTRDNQPRTTKQAKKRATAALVARLATIRDEEVAREKAKDRAREIRWISQEAKESIGKLAKMAQRVYPVSELGGDDMVLYEQSVRKAAERADDLLEYLWDKMHSGTWVLPQAKEGLDLDELLRSVWQPEGPDSYRYFPRSTQKLAASLLRKLRKLRDREACDDTVNSKRLPSTTTTGVHKKPSCDFSSWTERNRNDRQAPRADSQPHAQATKPRQSSHSQDLQSFNPVAMYYKWQYEMANRSPEAGSKRARPTHDEDSARPSKRQRKASDA